MKQTITDNKGYVQKYSAIVSDAVQAAVVEASKAPGADHKAGVAVGAVGGALVGGIQILAALVGSHPGKDNSVVSGKDINPTSTLYAAVLLGRMTEPVGLVENDTGSDVIAVAITFNEEILAQTLDDVEKISPNVNVDEFLHPGLLKIAREARLGRFEATDEIKEKLKLAVGFGHA